MFSKLLKLNTRARLRHFSNRPEIERKLPPQVQFNVTGPSRLKKTETWPEWIITMPGRKAAAALAVGSAATVTTALWVTHTVFPSWTQTFYEEQRPNTERLSFLEKVGGEERTNIYLPSPELVKLNAKLWQRAGLSDEDHENVELFTSTLLDPVLIGSTHCREGASVGFPRHMMWTSENDIDLDNLRIKPYWNPFFPGFSIPKDVDPADLEELKESLILSPAAREFIVSNQLLAANGYLSWIQVFLPGAFMLLHYVYGVTLNQKLDLISKPRYQRLGFQMLWFYLVFMTFIMMWNLVKQMSSSDYLESVVRSPEDARAALEFYTAMIKRNKILRKILGPESHYYFLENGEIIPNAHEFEDTNSLQKRVEHCEYLITKHEAIQSKLAELKAEAKS